MDDELLATAAEVSPYFAVSDYDGDPAWLPLRVLVEDGDVLAARVDAAQGFLAERIGAPVDRRACASINSLGLVSRLVSPALAFACLGGVVPRLGLDDVYWQPVEGGPVPIALNRSDLDRVTDAAGAAAQLIETVLDPVVTPVLAAYREQFAVSPQVLTGNVASALAGAAGMLARSGGRLQLDPVDVVDALLAQPPLAGSGRYETPRELAPHRFFVRHNCCLFYRVPGGGKCGDCVLVPEAARLDGWRRSLAQATTGSSD